MGANKGKPRWHSGFLRMLPTIRRNARYAFRHLSPELRDECVQDVICNCCIAYRRLFRKGQLDRAFPSPLASFAIRQVRSGRQSGTKLNVHDVSSRYAQLKNGFHLCRLDQYDEEEQVWKEVVLPDNRYPIPDCVAFRIDYPNWLKTLKPRDRSIAKALARGDRTQHVARRFGLSDGRISQKRQEYHARWDAYQGDA